MKQPVGFDQRANTLYPSDWVIHVFQHVVRRNRGEGTFWRDIGDVPDEHRNPVSALNQCRGLPTELRAVHLPALAAQHSEEIPVAADNLQNSTVPTGETPFETSAAMVKRRIRQLAIELRRRRINRGVVIGVQKIEAVLRDAIVEPKDAAIATDDVTPAANGPRQSPCPRAADAALECFFPKRGQRLDYKRKGRVPDRRRLQGSMGGSAPEAAGGRRLQRSAVSAKSTCSYRRKNGILRTA